MIIVSPHEIRLTRREQDGLRSAARQQGVALRRLKTPAEVLDAALAGLSLERKQHLLNFLEAGESSQARGTKP